MINYNQYYHIDDVVLSSFCPNTNKVNKKDKYIIFKDYLHSFHNIPELYESSANNYAAYIIYSILLNSLELNKNILSYEHYFYNVMTGFSEQTGNKITSSNIAKYWNLLVGVYDELLVEVSKPNVKEVLVIQKKLSTTKFINIDRVNNSYYWDIPVQIIYDNGSVRNILIIPFNNNLNIFSNFLVLNTINQYRNNGYLSIIQVYMDTINLKFNNIALTDSILRYIDKFIKDFYIDFSTSNLANCSVCPVAPCSVEHMFKVVQPTTVQRIKKIKLVHE